MVLQWPKPTRILCLIVLKFAWPLIHEFIRMIDRYVIARVQLTASTAEIVHVCIQNVPFFRFHIWQRECYVLIISKYAHIIIFV
jgi:hypothetical protein